MNAEESSKRVLVVDDEPDVRSSLAMILGLEKYHVSTASHGAQALEMLEDFRPDVVISDFMMPFMNGRELIQQMKARERLRHVPAIVVSAVEPGPPAPWDAYLRKPVEVNELLGTIERLLERSER